MSGSQHIEFRNTSMSSTNQIERESISLLRVPPPGVRDMVVKGRVRFPLEI